MRIPPNYERLVDIFIAHKQLNIPRFPFLFQQAGPPRYVAFKVFDNANDTRFTEER